MTTVLGVANVLLVVVGLVLHSGVIGGRGYDLAVYNGSVLGELEVDLVAIDIDGLDGQLDIPLPVRVVCRR